MIFPDSLTRKATFDMFNFLASQHRELPDILGPFDEEEDEFPLKSSRLVIQFASLLSVKLSGFHISTDSCSVASLPGEPPAVSFPWQ